LTPRLSEMGDLVAAVLDAMPSPIFVVDDDVQILGYNLAASQMLAQEPNLVFRRRAGEILHCLHATETPGGCGRSAVCKDCPVRDSVREALSGQRVVRARARMQLLQGKEAAEIFLLVTTAPLVHQGQSLVLLILEDISELMELKKILPICSHCKRIRNDQEYWQVVESYFEEHLDLDFSHGICPECAKKLYADYYED
jgi:PAS domain-containing protein